MTAPAPAPGLTADWLNAWLAAVGVTVLVPEARLGWTDDVRPVAEFDLPGHGAAAEIIAAHLPTIDDIDHLAIARHAQNDVEELRRKVSLSAYRQRAALTRASNDFSLGVSITDLTPRLDEANLPHSPFDPPAPRGETLHSRLRKCVESLGDSFVACVDASLQGHARRVLANGLGFDFRRLASGSHADGNKYIDPVVEILAFYGLAFFPMRGGLDGEHARGWTQRASRRGAFQWPVWRMHLDRWAIDALLDRIPPIEASARQHTTTLKLLRVTAIFGSVPYQETGPMDATRAYASERVW
jgi:hypothetical protein